MDFKQSQQIRKYIDMFFRRKAMIISFLLLGVAGGLIVTVTTPKEYRAAVLLSYQVGKVNPARMSPEDGNVRNMVNTLKQIVTSRSNLENVIKQFNLYGAVRNTLPMEDVTDLMRKKISIQPSSGDTFIVGFEGSIPEQVVRVANSLAAKFIEENIKYREERASETSVYTNDELQMAKVVLDKKDDAMREYQLKYYNEMPEQREGNFARLNALQQQYQGQQANIQDLERTKVMIQEQMTARKNSLSAANNSLNAEGTKESFKGNAEPGESEAHQLERMKRLYDSLLIKYTAKHPEVIRVQRIIEKLEKAVGNQTAGPISGKNGQLESDPVLAQLTVQIKKLEIDIDRLNKEQQRTKDLIKKYEEWIAGSSNRAAEWTGLTRDYGELKKRYDFLVAQDLQSNSVLRLEQKQKGSQFKIEDSARLPEKPFKPNFYKIMGMAIALGLSLGCGLVVVESFLDSSFKDRGDLEAYLGVPIVCSLPYIYTEEEKRRGNRVSLGWTIIFILSVSVLGLAFLYFWRHGLIILKLG